MSGRPRVFVARRIPDEGLAPIAAACDLDLWDGRAAAATGRAPAPRRGVRRRPDPADRPGRRRVPRRCRTRVARRLELRRGVRQHRCRCLRATRHPRRQHARRPHRDDRGPGLGAADGGCPSPAGGRPLRPRRTLEDVGPVAAAGARRPRRDDRDRRLRADRTGRRPAGAGFGMRILYHDVVQLPDDVDAAARARPTSPSRRCWPRATSSRSTST